MRLPRSFYERDALVVAPEILGKLLVRRTEKGLNTYMISDVEAYRGTEDQASHARFGKTPRNSVMFESGGILYMYFIYGMYWMVNIVTGEAGQPQAILIRGVKEIEGPGRVARLLCVDRSFNRENLAESERIWIEDRQFNPEIIQKPRYGIDYAGEPWKSMPWRYIMVLPPQNS
jgi:DNA-3-methyladenine glycosylase